MKPMMLTAIIAPWTATVALRGASRATAGVIAAQGGAAMPVTGSHLTLPLHTTCFTLFSEE